MAMLSVENLNIRFSTKRGVLQAVHEVSFSLEAGEVLGIVGESGCGKSITNLALMGLLPTTATVSATKMNFDGEELLDISEKRRRKLRGKKIPPREGSGKVHFFYQFGIRQPQ